MSEQDLPRLRVTNPAEVAELIPYLVGFIPEQSLVVIVTRNNRIEVTARADLTDLAPHGSAEVLLDRIWGRFPDADAYLVAYTDDHQAGWDMLQRCDAHLEPGIGRQAMLVDHDTWELADGEAGRVDRYGPASAQAAYYGLQVRPSRTDLEAGFASAPDTDTLTQRVAAVLDELPSPRDTTAIINLTSELLTRNLPPADPAQPSARVVPVEDAIKLAVLAQNPSAQSLALLSMSREDVPWSTRPPTTAPKRPCTWPGWRPGSAGTGPAPSSPSTDPSTWPPPTSPPGRSGYSANSSTKSSHRRPGRPSAAKYSPPPTPASAPPSAPRPLNPRSGRPSRPSRSGGPKPATYHRPPPASPSESRPQP
jgi:hypothetical protein